MEDKTREELWKILTKLLQHAFRNRDDYGWQLSGKTADQLPVVLTETVLLNLCNMLGMEVKASVVLLVDGQSSILASPRVGQPPKDTANLCLQGLQLFRQQQIEEERSVTVDQIIDQIWPAKGEHQ